jgi:tRNA-binding protein
MLSYEDFLQVDMRAGKIIEAQDFPEARTPAYKLTIDFGEAVGIKKSSSQITTLYAKEELIGKLVIGVVNFPPKQVGPYISEVLTLGFKDKNGNIVLATPDKEVVLGERLH